MSPLERLLLATHEERMAAARPKDLPMGPAASAAKAALRALRRPPMTPAERAAQRAECNRRMAAEKRAWKARKAAAWRLDIRTRSTAAVLAGATWAQAAEACGVNVRALGQAWCEGEEPPEVAEARREHYREKVRVRKARLAQEVAS